MGKLSWYKMWKDNEENALTFDNVKVRGLFRDMEVKESSREGQWIKRQQLTGQGRQETEGVRGSRMLRKPAQATNRTLHSK